MSYFLFLLYSSAKIDPIRLVSDYGVELYTPAFTSEHMNTVIALLLPHLSRWKSLSILTDCWAPMYTALTAINPFITRFGAPVLESLSLMRCNDLISFSPRFQPQHLKEPAFLKRGNNEMHPDIEWCPNMLPSLKYLSLRGVHVDWDTLGHSLSTSETGLSLLELAWHSHDVRPSPDQFHKLLSTSSGLRSLILSASGPSISEDVVHHDYAPAHLPRLRNISVGYRTALEGRIALELIDAPNAKELALEDATYAGDPDVINAGSLLSYIGTRQIDDTHLNHRITTCELPETFGYQATLVTEKALNISCTHVNKDTESRIAFPLLESVTLRGVKTCLQPLRAFLDSLSNLRHLDLTRMSMQAVCALLPSIQTTHGDCYTANVSHPGCPCPQLRSLCIRSCQGLDVQDVNFIVGGLAVERQNKGACQLREVDIHVDAAKMTCVPPRFRVESSPNMTVNIISDSSDEDEEDEDEDEDGYEDYEDGQDVGLDPYEPGGAFNDPLFDAYYSSHLQ